MKKKWFAMALLMLPAEYAVAGCARPTVTALTFGSYDSSTTRSVTATLTVNCTSGFAYQIGMGKGDANSSTRYMTNGSVHLLYNLYRDAAHTQHFGETLNVDTDRGTGTGSNQTYTIYGLIAAGEYDTPGSYTDTINAYVLSGLNTSMAVSATVVSSCTLSVSDLNFGNYAGTQVDLTFPIMVTCTNTTTYYVNLNDGLHPGTNYIRRMSGPGAGRLSYDFYLDAQRTSRWGNSNDDGTAGTGNGSSQSLTVYARLMGGQYVTPGAYSDTVISTVTY